MIDMEYNSYLQNCDNDDVLLFGSELCKIGKFKPALKSATGRVADVIIESLESYGVKGATIYDIPSRGSAQKANYKWLSEGKDCEILRIGAKCWQKGKIKIKVSIEFCPDEPDAEETLENSQPVINQMESPLDDIRQMMNGNI